MAAITSKEVALAAEALNRFPGLSPIARRVGIELINRADRKTGQCRPSEGRLALSLGCDDRSVRRAKVELQAAGFLCWHTPGHHKRSIYQIMWSRLCDAALRLKRKIRQAADPAIAKARHDKAVKWRRYLNQEPLRRMRQYMGHAPVAKSDRTKMSGNPTTHINQFIKALETGKVDPLREASERRFWADISKLPDALSAQITAFLEEDTLERALEAERRLWGDGIQYVIHQMRGNAMEVQS